MAMSATPALKLWRCVKPPTRPAIIPAPSLPKIVRATAKATNQPTSPRVSQPSRVFCASCSELQQPFSTQDGEMSSPQ